MFNEANVTVLTEDFEASLAFYTEKLGFAVQFRNQSQWAEVAGPGLTVGIAPKGDQEIPPSEGRVSIGLNVEDLEDAVNELKGKGVSFVSEPLDNGLVYLAFFVDPDGNRHYVYEIKV